MAEGLLNYTRLDDPRRDRLHHAGPPDLRPADEVRLVDEQRRRRARGRAGLAAHPRPVHPARLLPRRGAERPRLHRRRLVPQRRHLPPASPEGNLVVEGRDKDMINRGGEKISAEEVENLDLPAARGQPGRRRRDAGRRPGGAGLPLRRPAAGRRRVTLDDIRDAMHARRRSPGSSCPSGWSSSTSSRRPRSGRSTRRRCGPTSHSGSPVPPDGPSGSGGHAALDAPGHRGLREGRRRTLRRRAPGTECAAGLDPRPRDRPPGAERGGAHPVDDVGRDRRGDPDVPGPRRTQLRHRARA